ncbi:MAG TPA: SWIM zinc finger family protein [Chthonomonadaceae bacterium]|nr:SWIM zinc finger family protein [Chthonomonadaceae bacterium]
MAKSEAPTGADIKSKFKPLTEEAVQESTDGGSFSRGKSYYRSGHIFDAVVRGNTISARCEGSDVRPYTVRATLPTADQKDARAVISYECDCPRGGFCKHVVALLLTWIHKPETFEVRPEIAALLKDKSREELLALVLRMVEQNPELESLLDLPFPTAAHEPGAAGRPTILAGTIRKQTAAAFRRNGYEWGAASAIASDLEKVYRLGEDYARAGQWANALVVYSTLTEEIGQNYGQVDDEEGDLAEVAQRCCDGLAQCLEIQKDLPEGERLEPDLRAQLVKSLYDLWNSDTELGGIDLAADVPEVLACNVTDAERAQVEEWVRRQMRPGRDFSANWHNRALAEFLMTLKEHAGLDDEARLAEYRNFRLYEDMAAFLAERGRVDEALGIAEDHLTDWTEVLGFARTLAEQGKESAQRACAFVEARLKQAEKAKQQEHAVRGYLDWLGAQYTRLGMTGEALAIQLRRFQADPSPDTYQDARAAALLPGQPPELWAELRPNLIATLEQKKAWSALVSIYLEEKQVRDALDALARFEMQKSHDSFGLYWGVNDLRLRCAQAAEKEYPDEARTIYQNMAEDLIEQRGRGNYQEAAKFLRRVRDLYQKQGRGSEWQTYIASLRERNKSLRAFKEELDALKLA